KTFGPLPEPVSAVTFSRDFALAGAAAGKTVKGWNLADGKELLSLAHPAEVTSLSFSADKARLATGAADKTTRLWEGAPGRELQFSPQAGAVRAVVYHTNNAAVISAGAGKLLVVDTPAVTRAVPVASGPVHALALTPNASHVLTAGADKLVSLWNTASGA